MSLDSLSKDTIVDICTAFGKGVANIVEPAELLQWMVRCLLSWGEKHFWLERPCTVSQFPDAWSEDGHTPVMFEHRFDILYGHLSNSVELNSTMFEHSGRHFYNHIDTHDGGTNHIGAYMTSGADDEYAAWWPFCARFAFAASTDIAPGFSYICMEEGCGRGSRKLVSHELLLGVPAQVGHLQDWDVRVSLAMSLAVFIDSVRSLCVADAAFHPLVWSSRSVTSADALRDLKFILSLDELPCSSEDDVLKKVLTLPDISEKGTDTLLSSVRWHVLSPTVLFELCCLNGLFRKSASAKAALARLFRTGR